MSAIRRYMANDDENSVFKFTIDTTKINPSGTDGSENPLTFRIPSRQSPNNSAIIRVSDGRPDIIVNSSTTNFLLTFASSGVYEITIIGRLWFSFVEPTTSITIGYDFRKIILITHWPQYGSIQHRAFAYCENLVIDSPNALILPPNTSYIFRGIKEIRSNLNLIDTSKCTDLTLVLNGLQTPLSSTFNPFFNSLEYPNGLYSGITFTSDVTKIEIISTVMTRLYDMWNSVVFQALGPIELICDTPNVTQVYRLLWNGQVKTRCHAGRVDVRNVTNTAQWLYGTLTTAQVDATLLGWANNLPFMQSGVTWNWNGSKYSNDPAVIAAYNKITSDWGVIFTNLTME